MIFRPRPAPAPAPAPALPGRGLYHLLQRSAAQRRGRQDRP